MRDSGGASISIPQAEALSLARSGPRGRRERSGRVWILLSRQVTVLCAIILASGCSGRAQKPRKRPTSQGVAAKAKPVVHIAERGPLKVAVSVDRDRVEIPDPIKLTIHIEVEAGVEVGVPKLEGLVGEFGVGEVVETEPDCGDLLRCKEWIYTLDSFVDGVQQIPSLPFSFRDPREKADGSHEVYEDKLTTAPIEITVTQTLADVKDPVDLPMPFRYRLLWWAVGVVTAMVAIALGVRWWRRYRKEQAARPAVASVPPHVWAMKELDKLIAEDLVGRGLIQEFYYRINGLLRRYIELRFGLMAGEQTSEEFVRALQYSEDLKVNHKTMLQDFVEACDPVKYAKHQPCPDEINWVQASARDFVTQTAVDVEGDHQNMEKLSIRQEVAV